TTNQGHFVLSNNGNPIQPNGDDITISRDGTIQADGMEAQLNIAYIDDVNNLAKEGDDLYTLEEGQIATAAESGADLQVHLALLDGLTVGQYRPKEELIHAHENHQHAQAVVLGDHSGVCKAASHLVRLR